MSFSRPRTETLKLDVSIHAGNFLWSPASYWEAADIHYFAATALPLQTQTMRAPAGMTPSKSRQPRQLPNIAGRWVLKFNPAKTGSSQGNSTDRFVGWAETHATYTTFTHAELVVWIADDYRDDVEEPILNLVAAHCAALHDQGVLRIIPADALTASIIRAWCMEDGTCFERTVWDFGKLMSDPGIEKVPGIPVFDVVPSEWGQTVRRSEARKAMRWLRKRPTPSS